MKNYSKYVILSLIILIIICSWLCCLKNVKPDTFVKGCKRNFCSSNSCYGRDCKTGICEGVECIAGDCIGEYCKAGDCIGTKCKAGDCYGYGCKPGICIDPKCDPKTCPQVNKNCIDGKLLKIKRPFYYDITKHLLNDTILNPPICRNYITLKDLKDGRAKDLDLMTVNIYRKGSVPYSQITNPNLEIILGTHDSNIISTSYPGMFKNDNCEICTKSSC